jgi:hypothetical protein
MRLSARRKAAAGNARMAAIPVTLRAEVTRRLKFRQACIRAAEDARPSPSLPALPGIDAPQSRLEARAAPGLEPTHVLNAGACDIDGPVRPLGESIGPAEPLVLDESRDALAIPDLHRILLDRAEIEPPALRSKGRLSARRGSARCGLRHPSRIGADSPGGPSQCDRASVRSALSTTVGVHRARA